MTDFIRFLPRYPGDNVGGYVVREERVQIVLYAGRVDEKGRSLAKDVEVRVASITSEREERTA